MQKTNNILFPSDTGGCYFYRLGFPSLCLQTTYKNINNTELKNFIPDSNLFKLQRTIIMQRFVSDNHLNYFKNFLSPLSKHCGLWTVFEIDDVVVGKDIPNYNAAKPQYIQESFYNNIKYILTECDLITVTTEELKSYYVNEFNLDPNKVIIIPNYLPRWWIGEAYNLAERIQSFEDNK